MADIPTEVSGLVVKIEGELEKMAVAVNFGLRWLPSVQGVQGAWDRAVQTWNELTETIDELQANPGTPTVRLDAVTWNRDIGGTASTLAGRADPGYTNIRSYWEGDGVEAYLAILPAQGTALERIKETFSDPAATMLEEMGSAIETLWGTVTTQLVILYAATAAALLSCLKVAFIPAGVGIFAAALTLAINEITSAYSELRSVAAAQRNLLEQRLHDDAGFPDSRWPRSTIEG